jgi:hypothetical protein
MIELEACLAMQLWVNREYRRGLRMHPCGAPGFSKMGASVRKSRIQLHRVVSQSLELNDKLVGYYGVEC